MTQDEQIDLLYSQAKKSRKNQSLNMSMSLNHIRERSLDDDNTSSRPLCLQQAFTNFKRQSTGERQTQVTGAKRSLSKIEKVSKQLSRYQKFKN